jgi:hypothetical protein
MGLKDFFSSEGRAARSLQKHVNRARNKDSQHVDRQTSLDVLRDAAQDGSEEAMAGLLGRFTIRYDKSIEDEQEKEFVAEELINLGKKVLPQLQKHLRNADSIAYGLKVLHAVADRDAQWPILQDLCERNDNTYTRDPSKKIQIIDFLGEQDDKRCAEALLPYLEDMDEGVRYATVEALLRHKNPEVAREPLCKLLINEKEDSRRAKKRILDGFAELGWDVKGFSGTVEKMLSDYLPGSRLDNHGRIRTKQV